MVVLVTGAAGFIGFHLSLKLIKKGFKVIGIDNLNSYYSQLLKEKRIETIEEIRQNDLWSFFKVNLEDTKKIDEIFKLHNPNIVINLAAQAGVRYSLENPMSYVESNLVGFLTYYKDVETTK